MLQDDSNQMNKIRDLSEARLISKGMIRFFVPIMTLGVLSMIFPYVYAFLPVHESELCVCSFYH